MEKKQSKKVRIKKPLKLTNQKKSKYTKKYGGSSTNGDNNDKRTFILKTQFIPPEKIIIDFSKIVTTEQLFQQFKDKLEMDNEDMRFIYRGNDITHYLNLTDLLTEQFPSNKIYDIYGEIILGKDEMYRTNSLDSSQEELPNSPIAKQEPETIVEEQTEYDKFSKEFPYLPISWVHRIVDGCHGNAEEEINHYKNYLKEAYGYNVWEPSPSPSPEPEPEPNKNTTINTLRTRRKHTTPHTPHTHLTRKSIRRVINVEPKKKTRNKTTQGNNQTVPEPDHLLPRTSIFNPYATPFNPRAKIVSNNKTPQNDNINDKYYESDGEEV